MPKETKSTIEQLIRIILWMAAPLMVSWGIDANELAAQLVGVAIAVGNFGFWVHWQIKRKPD